jgi:hypothetical protein
MLCATEVTETLSQAKRHIRPAISVKEVVVSLPILCLLGTITTTLRVSYNQLQR